MNPLAQDLDHILDHTKGLWEELRGKRVFVTGGTGFFGCWLLESFIWANDKLELGASATVLTRNPEAFCKRAPHLALHNSVRLHSGDVRSFDYPAGEFSHIIHAATESCSTLNERDPLLMLDTIVAGTRRVLDFSVSCGAAGFLFTSSGAVYWRQPSDMTGMDESYRGAPETMDVSSAYGEGKRAAELLCAMYRQEHRIETKIARCFAFVGPYLPLDAHFAIGNFIRDCIEGRSIRVKGDGSPYRSYLYAADLIIWLWTILIKGRACRPYNVGSEEGLSILQLASQVSETLGSSAAIEVCEPRKQGEGPARYVPSTARARDELGLLQLIPLETAIRRTYAWNRKGSHCSEAQRAGSE